MMQCWEVPLFGVFFPWTSPLSLSSLLFKVVNLVCCWRWKHFENAVTEIKKGKYLLRYTVTKNFKIYSLGSYRLSVVDNFQKSSTQQEPSVFKCLRTWCGYWEKNWVISLSTSVGRPECQRQSFQTLHFALFGMNASCYFDTDNG